MSTGFGIKSSANRATEIQRSQYVWSLNLRGGISDGLPMGGFGNWTGKATEGLVIGVFWDIGFDWGEEGHVGDGEGGTIVGEAEIGLSLRGEPCVQKITV